MIWYKLIFKYSPISLMYPSTSTSPPISLMYPSTSTSSAISLLYPYSSIISSTISIRTLPCHKLESHQHLILIQLTPPNHSTFHAFWMLKTLPNIQVIFPFIPILQTFISHSFQISLPHTCHTCHLLLIWNSMETWKCIQYSSPDNTDKKHIITPLQFNLRTKISMRF